MNNLWTKYKMVYLHKFLLISLSVKPCVLSLRRLCSLRPMIYALTRDDIPLLRNEKIHFDALQKSQSHSRKFCEILINLWYEKAMRGSPWKNVRTVRRTVLLSLILRSHSWFEAFFLILKIIRTPTGCPYYLAGAEGFEPSALGFGDRCSTSWAIPL